VAKIWIFSFLVQDIDCASVMTLSYCFSFLYVLSKILSVIAGFVLESFRLNDLMI